MTPFGCLIAGASEITCGPAHLIHELLRQSSGPRLALCGTCLWLVREEGIWNFLNHPIRSWPRLWEFPEGSLVLVEVRTNRLRRREAWRFMSPWKIRRREGPLLKCGSSSGLGGTAEAAAVGTGGPGREGSRNPESQRSPQTPVLSGPACLLVTGQVGAGSLETSW